MNRPKSQNPLASRVKRASLNETRKSEGALDRNDTPHGGGNNHQYNNNHYIDNEVFNKQLAKASNHAVESNEKPIRGGADAVTIPTGGRAAAIGTARPTQRTKKTATVQTSRAQNGERLKLHGREQVVPNRG